MEKKLEKLLEKPKNHEIRKGSKLDEIISKRGK